ncbi:hypothetical protein FHS15_003234 [Paenibacillus castaneae]|uniref:hypothetical protein n=1 Tax=Paenibacillus castaneae TaxID=474957 RepID=UPI000C9B4AAA|nr:hypothetical protein [Paenibacillus castaneae]NIK78096.1 hypothetical protein [Paenibacillus castaneae]
MWRKGLIVALAILIGSLGLGEIGGNAVYGESVQQEASGPAVQKRINIMQQMPNMPEPLLIKDWKETALAYDRFVFDFTKQGTFLPVGWWDQTHHNLDGDTFGLMSYVGKFSQGADGSQEAINMMAAVLSATLVGIDKSDQNGHDYVKMLQTFYNKDNGENVILNNPKTVSGQTFWYELLPHVLFYALTSYYPDVADAEQIMRDTADKWAAAVQELGGKYGRANFNYTAFDFHKMEPFRNEKWTEPDAAAGVALLEYLAYAKFGNADYLKAAELSMDFLERQQDNPLYEVLLYSAPYIAARMNAEQGKQYDVSKMINWVFDGGSKVRDGWGTMTEKWGDYNVHGLLGSLNDNGGYAFAMNTFAAFGALAPVVRYDPRYARDIGKWMLNAANQSRLFYADELPSDYQSGSDWKGDPQHVIPYEGLRKELNGKSPYASGDPTVYAWGNTDFSLYSGSFAGYLGGLIEKTNVEGILKIDALKTDYYHEAAYPTFLYYNPYESEQNVEITDLGNEPVDLYDSVTGSYVAKDVKDKAELRMSGDTAAVIVIVPAEGSLSTKEQQTHINDVFVAPAAKPAVNIVSLQKRQLVSGKLKLDLETAVPAKQTIRKLTVSFAGKEIYSGEGFPGQLELDTTAFGNGFHQLEAVLESSSGQIDKAEIELFARNEGGESILNAGPESMLEWKPIEAMPGYAAADQGKLKVTENNDAGGYGGITSPVFQLDFSRKSYAIVDIDSVSAKWALQMHVKGEPWGYYVKPDGTETGHFILDVMKEMRRMHPDMTYLGVQDVEIWLIAAGAEGAQAEFQRVDMFYQDDQPLNKEEWSGLQKASSMVEWQSAPSFQGGVIIDQDTAVIQEDSILNRGGVSSPFMTVDFAQNPVLTVDIADVTDQWSIMLYMRGQQEGLVVQAPTSSIGKASYDLKVKLKEAYPELQLDDNVEMQLWFLAEGADKASVGVRSFELEYVENGNSMRWLYAIIAAGLVGVLVFIVTIRRRKYHEAN